MSLVPSQVCGAVLMVRPKHFGFNAETALTNSFQQAGGSETVAAQALAEFDAFATALAAEGVSVCVAEDWKNPASPTRCSPTTG